MIINTKGNSIMTNAEYQEIVEKKFNKPLENIMYELCVVKDLIASEGARTLDVPKDVFITWRNRFRFGPIQRRADAADKLHIEKLQQYKNELQNIDFNRKFKYSDRQSLDGFKEMLERLLELQKARKIKYNPEGLGDISIEMNIMVIEQAISYLDSYLSGELLRKIEIETQHIKQSSDSNKTEI